MPIAPASAALASDIINGTAWYAADAQASDTYVITLPTSPGSYVNGAVFRFKANTANTGAATLNVNGLGAKSIVKNLNVALATGDILAGQIVEVSYDGTNLQMVSPTAQSLTYAIGSTTKDISGNGAQTIAHGLGVIPKRVEVTCSFASGSNCISNSIGRYIASTEKSNSMGGSGTTWNALQVFAVFDTASAYNTGVITVDATNITLTWTKTGSPTGTATINWEAIA